MDLVGLLAEIGFVLHNAGWGRRRDASGTRLGLFRIFGLGKPARRQRYEIGFVSHFWVGEAGETPAVRELGLFGHIWVGEASETPAVRGVSGNWVCFAELGGWFGREERCGGGIGFVLHSRSTACRARTVIGFVSHNVGHGRAGRVAGVLELGLFRVIACGKS